MQMLSLMEPEVGFYFIGYLDPGTGSLVIQILIGLIVGVGATVKIYWGRIKHYLNKNN